MRNTQGINMSSFEFISTEIRQGAFVITFKRPDLFNAMNGQMKKEIIRAIKEGNKNADASTLILTGEGKAFSSGQDLGDRKGLVDLGHTLKTEWNPLIESIQQSEKIVFGALNGVSAGAGLSVALSCDLIYAKPGTRFVSGFSAIGLAPDAGSGHIMIHAMGYAKALEFFLSEKGMVAEDLVSYGLLNATVESPLEHCLEQAERLSKMAPLSLKLIKKNLVFARDHSRQQTIERETYVQRYLGWTEDYGEGVKAFHEKRKPQFKGK